MHNFVERLTFKTEENDSIGNAACPWHGGAVGCQADEGKGTQVSVGLCNTFWYNLSYGGTSPVVIYAVKGRDGPNPDGRGGGGGTVYFLIYFCRGIT